MRTGSRVAILLTLVAAAACASGGAGTRRPSGRDRAVIRYDELRESHGTDLLTTVLALRPFWLNRRGSQSGEVIVYVDNMRYGTARALRSIDVSTVAWLEYMTGPEASARLGRGHPHGAILVHTRRGEPVEGEPPDESAPGQRAAAASHASAARAIAGGTACPPSNSSYRTS